MSEKYNWTDNPTEAQISAYNPDVLNDCLMHLKYNNLPAKTNVFCINSGNVNIKGDADLIESELSTNLVFATAGTYTVNIPTSGIYDVVAIGGGAGGAWGYDVYGIRHTASGGSGAGFVGKIYIAAGTYTAYVGAGGAPAGNGGYGGAGGNTEIVGVISAGGGAAGAYATWGNQTGSAGGVMSISTSVESSSLNVNGNSGSGALNAASAGGVSVFNGYGKGGDADLSASYYGSAGFLSLTFSGQTYINYKIGGSYPALQITDLLGEQFVVNGLNSDDSQYLTDGTYHKFVGADGSSELIKNTIYRQALSPAANAGDVWINTALEPFSVLKYNGSSWESYDKIPLGEIIVSNSVVSSFKTFPYNQNGYNANMRSPLGKPSGKITDLPTTASGGAVTAPYNGYIQLAALACNSLQIYNNSRTDFWEAAANQAGNAASVCVPCQKGDVIQIYYEISTPRWFRCYADEGAI